MINGDDDVCGEGLPTWRSDRARTGINRPGGGFTQGGYTYLALLFFIAILGVLMAVQGSLYSFARQRDKETELLFAGRQMKNAILSYYNSTPGNLKLYPPSLEVLLEDPRFPTVKRHLRKIPLDPMTNSYDWGLKQLETGEIIGVFSTSGLAPIKAANFRAGEADFATASSYQGWEFIATTNTEQTAEGGNANGNTGGENGQSPPPKTN